MLAPRLRHRVTFQTESQTQQSTTGAVSVAWIDYLVDEPAEFVPLSGREFLQAQTTQVEVSARVTVRYREDLTPEMRIVFDGLAYQIQAILPDASARRWLTIMVRYLAPYAENDRGSG